MRRRLPGIALRLERTAVVGDDVARVVDSFWRPQLDYRQLTGRTLFAPRARRPRWSPHLRVVLKLRDDLAYDFDHELMLGGNPLLDAPIDLSQRGRRNVDLALARWGLFALGFHTSPVIKWILGLLRRHPKLGINGVSTIHCHLHQPALMTSHYSAHVAAAEHVVKRHQHRELIVTPK